MNTQTKQIYNRLRRAGYTAASALDAARVTSEFQSNDHVRLAVETDEYYNWDNLKGDLFNPQVNSNISASRLRREEREFEERVNRLGVYGLVGEYQCSACGHWTRANSVWGFVGDDWRDSGYDVDIMRATLDAYHDHDNHK